MNVWSGLLEALRRHGAAALVSVVGTQGSSPREAGARMIVGADRSFTGTIGGGTLEWQAIEKAASMAKPGSDPRTVLRSQALGPDLGQCCGGRVDLLYEAFDACDVDAVAAFADREARGSFVTRGVMTDAGVRREIRAVDMPVGALQFSGGVLAEGFGDISREVVLFGAGHVGRALVLALAPLPFRVTWYDQRSEMFPARYPAAATARVLGTPEAAAAAASRGSFAVVMTHSHQLDQQVVDALLRDGRADYVGLIGSRTKRVRFTRRLAEAGLPEGRLERLVCPIGVPGVRSKHPAAIAASVAVQLLERDEALRASSAVPAVDSRA